MTFTGRQSYRIRAWAKNVLSVPPQMREWFQLIDERLEALSGFVTTTTTTTSSSSTTTTTA
jgi:cupin superfamily acireductone dioxygenase involved in methionine salvage